MKPEPPATGNLHGWGKIFRMVLEALGQCAVFGFDDLSEVGDGQQKKVFDAFGGYNRLLSLAMCSQANGHREPVFSVFMNLLCWQWRA